MVIHMGRIVPWWMDGQVTCYLGKNLPLAALLGCKSKEHWNLPSAPRCAPSPAFPMCMMDPPITPSAGEVKATRRQPRSMGPVGLLPMSEGYSMVQGGWPPLR